MLNFEKCLCLPKRYTTKNEKGKFPWIIKKEVRWEEKLTEIVGEIFYILNLFRG